MENINDGIDHFVRVNGGIIEYNNISEKMVDYSYYNKYWNNQMTKRTFLLSVFKPLKDSMHTMYTDVSEKILSSWWQGTVLSSTSSEIMMKKKRKSCRKKQRKCDKICDRMRRREKPKVSRNTKSFQTENKDDEKESSRNR